MAKAKTTKAATLATSPTVETTDPFNEPQFPLGTAHVQPPDIDVDGKADPQVVPGVEGAENAVLGQPNATTQTLPNPKTDKESKLVTSKPTKAGISTAKGLIVKELGEPGTTPFQSNKDTSTPPQTIKQIRRNGLTYQRGVQYVFTNADTSFIGEFESFGPDVVVRYPDGVSMPSFDVRNYQVCEATNANLAKARPAPPARVAPVASKYEDGKRYYFTSKGGEEFIGTMEKGVVYRNHLVGGCQVESALHEGVGEFKIREATNAEVRPLKVMPL